MEKKVSINIEKVLKRPLILFFCGMVGFLYSIIDFSNPIAAAFLGFFSIGGDLMGTIISMLQIVFSWEFLKRAGVWIAAGVVLAAFLAGFLFSGYFYSLNNAIDDKPPMKGEFKAGIKKYFRRMFFVNLKLISAGIIFISIISIASIPGFFVTWSWLQEKREYFFMMIMLNIASVGAVFLSYVYFRTYTFFYYPSSMIFENRPFVSGKREADKNFWHLAFRFIIFDLIFAVHEAISLAIRYRTSIGASGNPLYGIAMFGEKVIFISILFLAVTTFLFVSFKKNIGNS